MRKLIIFSIMALLVTHCTKKSASSIQSNTDSSSKEEKIFKGQVDCTFIDSVNTLLTSTVNRLKVGCAPQKDAWNQIEGYMGNLISSENPHWTRGLSYQVKIFHDLNSTRSISSVNMKFNNESLAEILEILKLENRDQATTKPLLDKIQTALSIKESQSELAKRYDTYWQKFEYKIIGLTKDAPVSLAKYQTGSDLLAEIGNFDLRPISSFDPISTPENLEANISDTTPCLCGKHLGVYMLWDQATSRMGAWRYIKTDKTSHKEVCESLLKGGTNIVSNKILEEYHREVLGQAVVCNNYLPYLN